MADSIKESQEFHFCCFMQVFGRSSLRMRQRSQGIHTRKMVLCSNDNWGFVLHIKFVWTSSAALPRFHLQSVWCSKWSIWFCRKFTYKLRDFCSIVETCFTAESAGTCFFPVHRHQTYSCKLSRILNWLEDTANFSLLKYNCSSFRFCPLKQRNTSNQPQQTVISVSKTVSDISSEFYFPTFASFWHSLYL